MATAPKATVQERLSWFRAFAPLYDKADPLIRSITSIQVEEDGEVHISPQVLADCQLTLGLILRAVKHMSQPDGKEMRHAKREFEAALGSCIKATDLLARHARFGRANVRERIHLINLLSSIVLAHECIESVSRKLNPVA